MMVEVQVKEVHLVVEELDLLEQMDNQATRVEMVVTVDPVLHQVLQDPLSQEVVVEEVVVLLQKV
tara:strand:- start:191 stop:385 length:195 start_codon:yes stop_codon:yes gene_type:complete